jgi:hypothetical protein
MFLFYMLIVILMFPAAGVLLLVSVHESIDMINAHQKQTHTKNPVTSAIKRATREITAIMGIGDD